MTETDSVASTALDAKDTSGDLMEMLACASICTGAQDFNLLNAPIEQLFFDLTEMP